MPETIILDIEGTVCPISFVHEVLFPFALKKAHAEIPKLRFPLDADRSPLERHLAEFPEEHKQSSSVLLDHIDDLVRRDVKASYLKSLQGFLWRDGYESGEIKAPIYEDAVVAMKQWAKDSKIYIFSSGSVPAQQLLFAHTTAGDLRPYISGYFDTVSAGPKLESQSYKKIAGIIDSATNHFFSDNPGEIEAAHQADWRTTFVRRPGNPEHRGFAPPGDTVETFSA